MIQRITDEDPNRVTFRRVLLTDRIVTTGVVEWPANRQGDRHPNHRPKTETTFRSAELKLGLTLAGENASGKVLTEMYLDCKLELTIRCCYVVFESIVH